MINISPDEIIIRIIRRHPWTILVRSISSFCALLLPLGVFILLETFVPAFRYPLTNLYWIAYLVYALFVFFFFMLMWVNYYLDFWVITSKKIIDVEFHGMFNHEVSEFPLEKIQDVTVHLQGVMPVFLDYGNVLIKTASETLTLNMYEVPHPTSVKDAIIELIAAPSSTDVEAITSTKEEPKKQSGPLIP